jgi:hypothetical protein
MLLVSGNECCFPANRAAAQLEGLSVTALWLNNFSEQKTISPLTLQE